MSSARRSPLNGNSVEIVGVMPPDFSLNKEVMPTVNKNFQRPDLVVDADGLGKAHDAHE